MGLLYPALARRGSHPPVPRSLAATLLAIVAVLAAHVALLLLLMWVVPAEHLAALARPLAVRMLEVAPDPPPKPVELPKPPPARKPPPRVKTPPPQQILAVAGPASDTTTVAFVVPPQPIHTPPPPLAAPMPVAVAVTVTPARFDADYLNNPSPAYPPLSRRLGEQGRVVLRVPVSADGRPGLIDIKTSSGYPRLDAAARDAVGQWRFVPARRGEEAVAATVLVPIAFKLEE
jgi:protein TonB